MWALGHRHFLFSRAGWRLPKTRGGAEGHDLRLEAALRRAQRLAIAPPSSSRSAPLCHPAGQWAPQPHRHREKERKPEEGRRRRELRSCRVELVLKEILLCKSFGEGANVHPLLLAQRLSTILLGFFIFFIFSGRGAQLEEILVFQEPVDFLKAFALQPPLSPSHALQQVSESPWHKKKETARAVSTRFIIFLYALLSKHITRNDETT